MRAVFRSENEERTKSIAASLAAVLPPGAVVLLYGELGAGKSTFVKGLARGLGIEVEPRSPTFALIREYPQLVHIDLYRLTPEECGGLGLEEYGEGYRAVAVEWADRAPPDIWRAASTLVKVTITMISRSSRQIEVSCDMPPPPLEAWEG